MMPDERGPERMSDREYINLLVAHEKELRSLYVSHERELREQYAEALETALRLQATEYERRLDGLNNEYARAKDVQHTYLPREVYEDFIERNNTIQTGIWKRLDEAKGASTRTVFLLGVAFSVLTLLMKFVPVNFGMGR